MNIKLKLITTVSTICLALVMCMFGVFSLKNISLNINGGISLTADNVKATISKGYADSATYTSGSSSTKMLAVTIDGNNNLTTVKNNLATWQNLGFAFYASKGDITISFSITNNHSTDSLSINAFILNEDFVNANAYINYEGEYVLLPGQSVSYRIIIYVENPNEMAYINDLQISFYLSKYEIPLESDFNGNLVFGSKTTGSPAGTASVSMASTSITSANIRFFVKDSSNRIYKVTSIPDNGFAGSDITSITIPNSVTSIGVSAFEYCIDLYGILTIPNSVTFIDTDAFEECDSLIDVKMSQSVTVFSDQMFAYCDNLQTVTIPRNLRTLGVELFCGCYSLRSFVIPKRVSSIGVYAFEACESLTSLIIEEGVTAIPDNMCSSSISLEEIIIPDSVTKIGSSAFDSCENLTKVIIGSSVKEIGSYAFSGTALEYAIFNDISAWHSSDDGEIKYYEIADPTISAQRLKEWTSTWYKG